MSLLLRAVGLTSFAAGILAAAATGASAQRGGGPPQPQRLDLALTSTVVTFPPSDPDMAPVVDSPPITITYRVRGYDGPWQITVLASGDLNAGSATVDISNVSWVATPAPPFRNGTLSKTVAQVVASGNGTVNPAASGSLTFQLKNSWAYSTGTYTQTLAFTLTTP
jgi:hypothetical protein